MTGTGHLTSGVNFIWSGARWSMSVRPLRLTVSHASLVFIGACWFVDHQMICTGIYKIYQNFKFYFFVLYSYVVSVFIGACWFRRLSNDLYMHIKYIKTSNIIYCFFFIVMFFSAFNTLRFILDLLRYAKFNDLEEILCMMPFKTVWLRSSR